MKKLIFLLLMAVALAGFVSALDTAHPPGVLTLEAALSGDGADGCAVIPDMVLVSALPVTAELSSFPAVMALQLEQKDQSRVLASFLVRIRLISLSDKELANPLYYLRC